MQSGLLMGHTLCVLCGILCALCVKTMRFARRLFKRRVRKVHAKDAEVFALRLPGLTNKKPIHSEQMRGTGG